MERAGIVIIALLATAGAHELTTPKRDRLELAPSRIRLVLEYSVTNKDAQALRQIFAGRADALTEYLAQQATHFLVLTVDGSRRAPRRERVTPFDGGVRVELSVELAAPPRAVRLEDRHKDRRVSVPVEIALDGLELARPLPPQPFVFAEHPLDLDLK